MTAPAGARLGGSADRLRAEVRRRVDELAPSLIEVSRAIHATPEPAFAEHAAVAAMVDAAAHHGLALEHPAFGLPTAFVADFGQPQAPRVVLISEYDALPDIGHACGHNLIAAIGLGAALALHALGERLPGSVRYLGTPGEERGCGKELLARAGAFDGAVAAMMIHPASLDLKAVRTHCIAEVEVAYRGRASHAALQPEAGRNALDAVVQSYQAIAALRQHIAAGERIHGIITDGGTAPNVVPERAAARYFVRAATAAGLDALKERVGACLLAGADATGCTAAVRWVEPDYLDMWVNTPLADAYEANAAGLGRVFTPYEDLPPGGTDMANVSHRLPVLHPTIACAPPEIVIHDARFARWAASPRGEQALVTGATLLAMTALDVLCDDDLRLRMGEAFAARVRQAQVSVSSVPAP